MKIESYYSSFSEEKVISILGEQIDQMPGLFKLLITLNSARYVGTSRVCGSVSGSNFELKNRKDPYFSLRARGIVKGDKSGTLIEIEWIKPKLPDLFSVLFLRRYSVDKAVILAFLREWLNIKDTADDQ